MDIDSTIEMNGMVWSAWQKLVGLVGMMLHVFQTKQKLTEPNLTKPHQTELNQTALVFISLVHQDAVGKTKPSPTHGLRLGCAICQVK